jgi:surfeit locus 1 family protein
MTPLRAEQPVPWRWKWPLAGALALAAFAVLVGLGLWQVERLQWKEGLIRQIDERIHAAPRPLAEIEELYRMAGDVDYVPVTAAGTFLHEGERHFLATWKGESGFYVYTPLRLADGRIVFVNRGFVPYAMKDPAKRRMGQVQGTVTVTGLARNALPGKPSSLVPDNDPDGNVFYWKDRDGMARSARLPATVEILPVFIDADAAPNPGGLPVGGVTMVEMPNNHLQYAVTWFGLAAALAGVTAMTLLRRRGVSAPPDAREP